jgi:hypothetical protein
LRLVGDVVMPETPPRIGVLLVHGRGVTRRESGFFDRIAAGLAAGLTIPATGAPGRCGSRPRRRSARRRAARH